MTTKLQLYKCDICGNIVQILHEGEGELVCCGEVMRLLEPKREDNMQEKHVPVFLKCENGSEFIQVGSIPHPMIQEHYIEFIETVSDDKNCVNIKFLHPEDDPTMISNKPKNVNKAYEYCNIHELWEGERD